MGTQTTTRTPSSHRQTSGKHQAPRKRRPRRRKTGWWSLPPLLRRIILVLLAVVVVGFFVNLAGRGSLFKLDHVPRWVDVQIIDMNSGGRRGEKLNKVQDIAIHYVGNPGTTAQANRDYFNQPETKVSAHFVVGLEGEVIQCIPMNEKSAATNQRNIDTISIEVCHPDATGKFNQATYDSLVKLTAWLCDACDIGRDQVIRHYDVTGKPCPLYFVDHPDAWEQFLKDVKKA